MTHQPVASPWRQDSGLLSRMLKSLPAFRKVKVQVKAEVEKVWFSLNLDLNLSL